MFTLYISSLLGKPVMFTPHFLRTQAIRLSSPLRNKHLTTRDRKFPRLIPTPTSVEIWVLPRWPQEPQACRAVRRWDLQVRASALTTVSLISVITTEGRPILQAPLQASRDRDKEVLQVRARRQCRECLLLSEPKDRVVLDLVLGVPELELVLQGPRRVSSRGRCSRHTPSTTSPRSATVSPPNLTHTGTFYSYVYLIFEH